MTKKRIRKKVAKRMAATTKPQRRARSKARMSTGKEPIQITGDELDPSCWVTPGVAEGDRETVLEDLAERDKLND